jgi:16S rRNA (cytosine1402-N4)-methyltransferase
MDRRQELTARTLVNSAAEGELTRLLRLYGELPNAPQMARAIVKTRGEKEIVTTFDLRDAVARCLPRGKENKWLAMLFQALRIEVNGELEALQAMLRQASELLTEEGRLVVMSYHSLEDRLVKNFMRSGHFDGELEKDFYGNIIAPLTPVTRKALTASEEELLANPRSRSAKLRVGRKNPTKAKEGQENQE